MLIVCPTCVSSYKVGPEILSLSRGTVRCAHCREAWLIVGEAELAAANDRIGEERVQDFASECEQNAWHSEPEAPQAGFHLGRAGPLSVRAVRPLRSLPPPVAAPQSGSAVKVMLLVIVGIGLGMAAVGWREPIVRTMPALTSLFAAIGLPTRDTALTLRDVRTATIQDGTTSVLTLEGRIENSWSNEASVPNIRIVVRDEAQQSLYSWTAPAPKASLGPGEAVVFKSRLVAPPGNGHDVAVGFSEASAVLSDAVVKGTK